MTDQVVLYDEFAEDVVRGWVPLGDEGDAFKLEFDLVGSYLMDDDFYQGLNITTVIRRKSDGKLFGYFWFDDISKHGESYIESNGDEHGFEWSDEDGSAFVWVEVEPYNIPAYRAKEQ